MHGNYIFLNTKMPKPWAVLYVHFIERVCVLTGFVRLSGRLNRTTTFKTILRIVRIWNTRFSHNVIIQYARIRECVSIKICIYNDFALGFCACAFESTFDCPCINIEFLAHWSSSNE